MNPASLRGACFVACLAASLRALAADGAAPEQASRARLAAERDAAQVRYEQAVRECEHRFAVTSCVDKAKAERRATLDRVAREQAVLDDAQRRRRADERRQRIAHKQAQLAAAREAQSAASMPPAQVRPPRQSPAARSGKHFETRSTAESVAQEAEAAARAAQARERRERARAHAQAVRQRNAERAAQRPPAAALPVPGASGASAVR
ncbi:MAG: hypothetical protein U1E90_10855 [Burkholderiaceae bacterium]